MYYFNDIVKMTSELLRKEEEFHKLNNELENKAKQLKEEANIVMVMNCLCVNFHVCII